MLKLRQEKEVSQRQEGEVRREDIVQYNSQLVEYHSLHIQLSTLHHYNYKSLLFHQDRSHRKNNDPG